MTDYPDDITTSKSMLEMLTVANEYCFFIESAESKTKEGIFKFVNSLLPLLYLKGTLLPTIEVENPEANVRFVTEEEWERIFTALREKFDDNDEFWIIDPQHVKESEPLRASLSENLADIYQDMKDLVMLYQKNTVAARENAMADCKLLFETHWGFRIANILPRLHFLLNNKEDEQLFDSLDFI
jgi:hypothetical protein